MSEADGSGWEPRKLEETVLDTALSALKKKAWLLQAVAGRPCLPPSPSLPSICHVTSDDIGD